MSKIFYMVYLEDGNAPKYIHQDYESAESEAIRLTEKTGKKAFVLESKQEFSPKKVTTYEDACKMLKYTEIKCGVSYQPQNENTLVNVPDKHAKALLAFMQLITIAEAWNKEDGFVPDYGNTNQYKYFPWFTYDSKTSGFVCSSTVHASSAAIAKFGSRLCFKTSERAKQFGVQFIDRWNDVLLFDENLPF